MNSLRGVARFARTNPHLLPHLGLRRAPGHYALTTLLHLLVSLLHGRGIRQKKAALERFSFHPLEALRFLGWDAV